MTPERIGRLAASYGIASEFRDARGQIVTAETDVQVRLLESMGVRVADALQAESRAQAAIPGALPPAMVVRADKGRVAIDLKGVIESPKVAWHIVFENGKERRGGTEVVRKAPDGAALPNGHLVLSDIPCGYHELRLDGGRVRTTLIVTPGRCWLPAGLSQGQRWWGISLQLYLLRSSRNWGIGDFGDLERFVTWAAGLGCQIVGLNPLHQMFTDQPESASPYSPATRRFLNILYIDVEAIPEFETSQASALIRTQEFRSALERCRAAPHVDYTTVTALKLDALRLVYAEFESGAASSRQREFGDFLDSAGDILEHASLFQALRNHHSQGDQAIDDPQLWPAGFRSAVSAEAREFARLHRHEIRFFGWMQWIADRQLAAAQQAATDAGMEIGLYRDLAVGCDRTGSETWSQPSDFMTGTQVGAPPDILNPAGQNWGLPPFNPAALIAQSYKPFIDLVRANMRHAGGLRIDHVMALQQLYCIPQGLSAAQGAYVRYPLSDLVGILALESHRHRCLVVGEDLGTVPPGFRERMATANILSYRVLFFEHDEAAVGFIAPEAYPRLAVAVAGSHDLPTLRGWWQGSDIGLKQSLGLYPSEDEAASQQTMRDRERAGVSVALDLGASPEGVTEQQFSAAVHRFLGQTSCILAMTQLDDLLGEQSPVNVPATSTEHANWRRKYASAIEDLPRNQDALRLLAALGRDPDKRIPVSDDQRSQQ